MNVSLSHRRNKELFLFCLYYITTEEFLRMWQNPGHMRPRVHAQTRSEHLLCQAPATRGDTSYRPSSREADIPRRRDLQRQPGGRPDTGEHLGMERSQLEKLVQTQKW